MVDELVYIWLYNYICRHIYAYIYLKLVYKFVTIYEATL